jgi:DNA-directed RNA polymerase sigma subunit (sigma70/sigma32)
MRVLKPRAREVIGRKYSWREVGLQQMATERGIARQGIDQIEKRALRRLRREIVA